MLNQTPNKILNNYKFIITSFFNCNYIMSKLLSLILSENLKNTPFINKKGLKDYKETLNSPSERANEKNATAVPAASAAAVPATAVPATAVTEKRAASEVAAKNATDQHMSKIVDKRTARPNAEMATAERDMDDSFQEIAGDNDDPSEIHFTQLQSSRSNNTIMQGGAPTKNLTGDDIMKVFTKMLEIIDEKKNNS